MGMKRRTPPIEEQPMMLTEHDHAKIRAEPTVTVRVFDPLRREPGVYNDGEDGTVTITESCCLTSGQTIVFGEKLATGAQLRVIGVLEKVESQK